MRLEIDNPTEVGLQAPKSSTAFGTEHNGSVDVNELLKRGIAAAQSGDRAQARTLLFHAAEADPSDVDVWLWLASISEYPEELLGFLKNVLDISPDHPRAVRWEASTRKLLAKTLVQRGASAGEAGQTDYAAQCFDKALEYDVQCEMAWLWKSSRTNDEALRVQYLEKVLEINPSNPEARDAFDAISRDRQTTRFAEARAAAVAGDWTDAENLIDEVLEMNLSHLDAWRLRSHISRSLEEQLLAYDRMLEIEPENAYAVSGKEFLSAIVESSDEQSVDAPELQSAEVTDDSFDEVMESPFDDLADSSAEVDVEVEPEVANEASQEVSFMSEETREFEFPTSETVESVSFEETEPESEVVENSVRPDDHVSSVDLFESPFSYQDDQQVQEEVMPEASSEPSEPECAEPAFSFEPNVESENEEVIEEPFTGRDDNFSFDHPETTNMDSTPSPASPFDLYDALDHHSETEPENVEPEDNVVAFDTTRDLFASHASEPVVANGNGHQDPKGNQCPYCNEDLQSQMFSCPSCRSILSLADIDALLGDTNVDRAAIESSITEMEKESNERPFTEQELTVLGIGHFNLKNYDLGVAYLQEASNLNLNNVILAGQLNTLAIRLDEIRRHSEDNESRPKGKTILVVDDSATVRKLISSKLEKSGHHVVCAEDGIAAMEVLTDLVPDLVLLDITMPRMDGYTVCKNIRSDERCKSVPVVMISGKDGFFDKVRGKMAGTTAYITKPFGPETLMRALENYLLPDAVVHESVEM